MKNDITRRDFTKLTTAAFGGVVAGAALGGKLAKADGDDEGYDPAKHACRGLNECAGHGADGENECAGQGSCATVSQVCGGHNACKYQGGCGAEPANNECAGQGGCRVPIVHDGKWAQARELFEARMTAAGKEFGDAPPAAE